MLVCSKPTPLPCLFFQFQPKDLDTSLEAPNEKSGLVGPAVAHVTAEIFMDIRKRQGQLSTPS
uniref:Uncharacterized protein n=1 Tax=Pseudomonas syringae pv. actinidiae TaxID=103796 RepID=A0A286JZX2_PSESF|nr:hypothetical protein [Pseudomonas syringae pv. actinidiae]